jgi:hypothetical protein
MAWGQPGRMRKLSSPLGFEIRSVQPVASRYTDCAIQIALCKKDGNKCNQQIIHSFEKKILEFVSLTIFLAIITLVPKL